ncbi:MAG TPA: MASE1 domain-containing protein [Leptolyngbyaceae cyanobacterium M65_K2018_010]|nr:MASE1 domain-containing protein [Leptolyngbyaceae cyanobacterium M65_K2018_010]
MTPALLPSSPLRLRRSLLSLLAVALGYFVLAKLSFRMPLQAVQVLPLWPPSGYSQSVLLWGGPTLAPGITLGSLWQTATSPHPHLLRDLLAALNNTLQPWLGLWLLNRVGFNAQLKRLTDVGALIGLAAVVPATLSATLGVTLCCLTQATAWATFSAAWFNWWIGNVTGVIVLTPLLITWRQGVRRCRQFYAPPLILLWVGILIALSWFIFCDPLRRQIAPYPLEYLPFPLVLWAALRLGPWGAALGTAVVTGLATWGIIQGMGPFLASTHDPVLAVLSLQAYICILAFTALILAGVVAEREAAKAALQVEKEKSEQLLLNILPLPIATRLKEDRTTIADHFAEVTVLFADIVEFTQISKDLSAQELVVLLNEIFSEFDQLAELHRLEKIKTIGDAYMAVGGIPDERDDHAQAIADMALDMQAVVQAFSDRSHLPFRLRIGLNTGPVVAGVIGTKKFIYDLWGDTVNTASRMESFGIPERIQVTETTYNVLKKDYDFEPRGEIWVKGKGAMRTFFLKGKRPGTTPP